MANSAKHLNERNLVLILNRLVDRPSWKKVMASIGASEATAFVWRAQSIKAAKENDRSSIFFLEWRGTWDFWHNHAGRSRMENIITYEASIRDEALNGREVAVLGPDQKPVYRERPEYIGRPDDFVMLSEGCEPSEVPFFRLERDAKGRPIPLTKLEFPPAPVRLRILEQDRRYVERKNLDVQHSGEVAVAKPLQRLPGEQRPDVEHLRRLAAMTPEQRRAALGASRVPTTLPQLSPAHHNDAPDDASRGMRPAPQGYTPPPAPAPEPAPEPPRPSYARPKERPYSEDHIGEGTPPPGGFRVA
jgi:hypothetical protein